MTNPLMSQDNGDGQRAASAVNTGLRAIEYDPSWNNAIDNFRETDANENSVTFQFESGPTTFTVLLSREA